MKTIKDLAKDALTVSNACNLSGVVHSFSSAMTRLREIYPNEGTAFYNEHPVAVLYSQAIGNITGSESFTAFNRATDECEKLSK